MSPRVALSRPKLNSTTIFRAASLAVLGVRLAVTVTQRPFSIFSHYPMFSGRADDYIPGHLRVNLIDASGNRLENVPIQRLMPLDGFRVITAIRHAMAHGSVREKHQLLAFMLKELNGTDWRARGERWPSVQRPSKAPFVAIEITKVTIHFDRYDPMLDRPLERARLVFRHGSSINEPFR